MKFKIDIYDSPYFPFALYRLVQTETWWRGERWAKVDHFATREDCKVYYEKIKDLPEYLN